MFSRIQNGWQLTKASWAVLRADKELLWFPVFSGIAITLAMITFFVPLSAMYGLFSVGAPEEISGVVGVIVMFIFYMISYTISFYFNTALIGAALIRLDGDDPTLRDGIRIANSKLGAILGYAAISATVGVILKMIQERGGIVGQILSGLGGLAWSVATFLVVPVLVTRDLSPFEAIKESSRLVKETWGEQLSGNFTIGGIFFLLYLALFIVIAPLMFFAASSTESGALPGIGIFLLIAVALLLSILSSAMQSVLQAAVYRFAEAGRAPDEFEIDAIRNAFQPKEKRG